MPIWIWTILWHQYQNKITTLLTHPFSSSVVIYHEIYKHLKPYSIFFILVQHSQCVKISSLGWLVGFWDGTNCWFFRFFLKSHYFMYDISEIHFWFFRTKFLEYYKLYFCLSLCPGSCWKDSGSRSMDHGRINREGWQWKLSMYFCLFHFGATCSTVQIRSYCFL